TAFSIFNFLTYGTTAVVARASGAGQQERAARLAAQALWVSLAIGIALLVLCEALAAPLLRGLGAHGRSGHYALVYFRIAAIGLPAALVALAGQGYLRGVGARAGRRRGAGRAPDRVPALHLPRARAGRDRDRGPGDRRPQPRRRRCARGLRGGGADDRVVGRDRRCVRRRPARAHRLDPARVHGRPRGDSRREADLAALRADATARRRRLRTRRNPDRSERHV